MTISGGESDGDEREFTFLVRIRRRADAQWRGSVHEVSSGKRRFITGANEITEFIAARLRADSQAER